jgi:hypothetical protein
MTSSLALTGYRQFAGTLVLFGLLVSIDLLFIAVHVLHVWSPALKAGHYSLEADGGMAEMYQYIKFIWLSGCLVLAFLQTRLPVYLGWMLLFGFLLLDDAIQMHERAGWWFADQFGFSAALGLRAKDFGEIAFAACIGITAVALVLLTFWRGAAQSKHVSADILCLLCVLAFFGVFFDAIHTVAYFESPSLAPVLALIEDGGEMIVVSVITAYAFDIASNVGELRIAIWQRLRRLVR